MAISADLLARLKNLSSSDSTAVTNVTNIIASLAGGEAIAGPLAASLNAAAASEFEKGLNRAFPQARETFAQMTDVAQSQMRGELPADVKAMIEQYSAEQGVQGGLHGGIARNRTARDLGRTSLDLVTQGQQSASELFRIAQGSLTAPTVDVGSLSTGISSTLAGSTTMSLAQAEQVKLEKARLAQSKKLADSGDRRAQAAYNEDIRRYDMEFEWERTMSELNLQMEKWGAQRTQEMALADMAFRGEQAGLERDAALASQRRQEDLYTRTLSIYQQNLPAKTIG